MSEALLLAYATVCAGAPERTPGSVRYMLIAPCNDTLRACDTRKSAFELLLAAFRQANKVADVLSNLAMDGCGWEGLRDPQAIPAQSYDQALSQSLFRYSMPRLQTASLPACCCLSISIPAPTPLSL